MVTELGGIDAVCPALARFPYETWLVPRAQSKARGEFKKRKRTGLRILLGDYDPAMDASIRTDRTLILLSLQNAASGGVGTGLAFKRQIFIR